MKCNLCKKQEVEPGKKSCSECLAVKRRQTQERNDRLRAQGICRCGKNKIVEGTTCCEPCRVRRIKYTQDRANRKRAEGLCPCGRDKPAEGKKLCQWCGELAAKRAYKNYKKNEATGNCTKCGKLPKHKHHSRCEKCLKYHRESQHLYHYGLERGAVTKMMDKQHGRCAMCGDNIRENYHVDHDHNTGEVRGLLCPGCNTFAGKYEKRMHLEQRIKEYLCPNPKTPPPSP